MVGRRHIAMVLAEFFGAIALTTALLAIGKSGVGYSYFLAGGVGLAAAAMALAVGGLSGANFNPAVSLGLWVTRKISTLRGIAFIVAQLLGGFAAWKMYEYLVGQPLSSTAGQTFEWPVLWAEALGGFVIVFIVCAAVYLGYRGIKFAATVGGAVFLGALLASLGSNGIGNPAVALGVQSWSKAYVLGPLLGGVLGALLYALIFAPKSTLGPVAVPRFAKAKTAPAAAKSKSTSSKKK